MVVPAPHVNANNEGSLVVLLHGLARSDSSFRKMEKSLQEEGYATCNISYPSTKHPIEELVSKYVLPEIKRCLKGKSKTVHFVTHSMGGIIVRYLATQKIPFKTGRVVMLSPPNKGSEVVDTLGGLWLFRAINGPAGLQLSTSNESLPNTLGKPDFELGIITGNKSINLVLSSMIEGVDDGKVSIESAKLEGMKDLLVVESAHPFIMKNNITIEQTKYFLKHAEFKHKNKQE
ncbi:MAG: alpha/beta hydrolase [Proteobacteria bacterium]|nr:alpha/beta hydrolase [Pseudomonadota bacterium]NOG59973.1 alpha/beta hydrolase [Pseudomonadota bacterium]